ncbi:hypothetical protein BT96DRAFT_564042 [Gymnopus androsaceus JB14]|uniref:Uncharacterized protein n=1 Tax=Gymnopus androsaceus JB14 TaxID=1447944 RepID=A0A6A4HUV2_9AGAR|nr:hypothetical protein BT96DRAFT_564042 [Gymnopus androsaceus JB14]
MIASLRAIFVHVNSLNAGSGNIKDMPNLAGYRTLNDVRFFVYGSSDIVNPRFPNITEEIWHIGGILALTPSALLSDPLGVYETDPASRGTRYLGVLYLACLHWNGRYSHVPR